MSAGAALGGPERLEQRHLLAVLYWDPDRITTNNNLSTGAGLGGTGVWSDGGAAVWFNPTTNAYVAWDSSLGDTAVFAGTAGGTVTVSGAVGAAAVEFRNAGYTVAGGSFVLPSAGTTFTATAAGRFDTPLAGAASAKLTKTGVASLTLGAALNTYTGDTIVSAGVLDVRGTIRSQVRPNGGSVQGVMFYDPDLAAAVREALGVNPDTWLTSTVLAESPALTSLTLDGNLVGDLTGIASLSALTSLQLVPGDYATAPQGLTALAPLTGLNNLTVLSLQHVGLTDAVLATLPALPSLTSLDVRANDLSTVPASVASRPLLATLFVHGNPLITDNPRMALASLRGRAVDVDVAPDRPETAASVSDLAARLYYLPLKMLEYVTNTVAFQPYSGAMKGPLATLQTKAGNDWDTNSLLAALYGAAGISTRYVAGVVEVTDQQLMDYVGTRDAIAAGRVLGAAGLAYDEYVNRFNHTWLEALVTVPATGVQGWVPIDASWKLRDYRPGLPGMLTNVPFDPLEFGYLTNTAWQKKSTAEYYEAKVAAWLAGNPSRADLTIADVGYDGPIRQQAFAALPTALPYGVVSQPDQASRPATLPASAQYTVNVKLADGTTALFGAGGVNLTLADVALSRLTINPGLDSRPTLRRDGAVLATAPLAIATPATTQLTLTITVTAPAGGVSYARTFTRAADRFIAIGLDANQFSESLLVEKRATVNVQQLSQANGAAIDRDQAVGGLLDLAIAQYFTASDADEASLAALTSAVADRTMVALGIATSGPALATTPTDGLQFPYLPADVGIDVPANVNGGFPIDPSSTAIDLNRNLLMGYANSSREGLVIEELTNFESVSTMKAFQLAAAASGGLANLVEINAANVGSIATLLPGVRNDIRNAIAAAVTTGLAGVADYAGVKFTALVPKNEITVGGGTDATKQWKGIGYTLKCVTTDPAQAALDGKTVGFIIHGAVGSNPLVSYGGAASRIVLPAPILKPTPLALGEDKGQGDPVNVATGGVYHEETDVEIPNLGVPLAFRRRYDSIHTVSGLAGAAAATTDRGMGEGWSFTYADRIESNVDGTNTVTWFTDSGARLVFTAGAGGFSNPAGVFGTLSGTVASGFTWKDFDGNATTFGPAVAGLCGIVSKRDRFGNGVKIDYVAGTSRIARVSDLRDATRFLSFTYNADARPHISVVADFTGRTWNFSYTSDGRLLTTTAAVPVAGAAAPTVRYAYHADAARRGLLASVTDPSGFVNSWEYYANRRGFRVTDAEGLRHSFTYNLFRRQSAFINERGDASRYAYDDQGNLLESQQPDRTSERSTWSTTGQRLSATDAAGATTTFAYDATTGKVTSATLPEGYVTTTTYTTGAYRDVDTITRLNRPNDASDDVVTKFTYDSTGFLTSRIDDFGTGKLNARTKFTAAAGGRGLVQSATSPRGVVTSFTYNTAGQVLSRATDSSPGVTVTQRFTYDTRGNQLAQVDGNGNTTTFTFDALGRVLSQSSADPDDAGSLPAIVSTFAYDIAGNLTSTTLNDGRVTKTAYDRRQRVVRITAADGTSTLVGYDPAGNKATETDVLGRVTRFTYDTRNRLVATLLPDGTTTGVRYDGAGRVVATLDQAGAATTNSYDVFGRKIRETLSDPDGVGPLEAPATAWNYDSRGNVSSQTLFVAGPRVVVGPPPANWQNTLFEYDNLGRKTRETQPDPDGDGPLARPVTSFTYDADGNLLSVTDSRGFATTYAYDNLGRRITETSPDPDGTGPLAPLVTRFVYDAAGNLRFEIAPGGMSQFDVAFTTEHVYDALNRETATILPDPDGPNGPLSRPTSTRAFDSSGFLASTTDALGRTTSYSSDRLGRVLAVTDPLGGIASTVYDAVGNTVISTDVLGRSTFTQVDALNRKSAVRGPRPDASSETPLSTFRYDAVGNLVSSTDALGRTTWRQYDALSRLIAQTSPLGQFAGDSRFTTRTEYDRAGRITATTDELGRRSEIVYDNLGRKIRTLEPDAGQGRPTAYYGYDAAGNLRYTTDPRGAAAGDPGFTTWFFYDALGRQIATVDSLGADWSITAIPDSLPASVTTNVTTSTYDALGRVASTTDALGRTTDYAYDTLGRKVAEMAPAPAAGQPRPVTRYAYDAVGNRTSVTTPLGFAVANAGFEQPGLATGTFQYAPTGSAWAFTGNAGISANGSGFTSGNPAAPGGTQVLFLKTRGSATQQVPNWQAGSYVLTFRAARRGNVGGANNFRVLIDGQPVGTFKPTKTSYDDFATASFTVTAGTHTIRFEGLNSAGGNNTALIDDVDILLVPAAVAPPAVGNAGFESPVMAAKSFQYRPANATWTFAGGAGISANGSAFTSGNPAAPAGTQVLFLQGANSSVTQQISNWQASTYTITFRAARRGNAGGANDFRILVDDQAVGTFKPANTSYNAFTTTAFTVTAGAHTIRFEGLNSAGGANTSFIDDVRIQCTGLAIAPGFTTTYAYDDLDRRTTVTDARGFATFTAYDAAGNTTSVTDASGNVTRYTYDRRNRLVTETDPLGAATTYAYDHLGNKTRETDRLGRVSTFVYDAADRLVEERWQTSATGNVFHAIKKVYDAAGRLLGVTETDTVNQAATTAWQFAYDALGNVVKSRMAPGEIVQQPISWAGTLATGDATIDWDNDGKAERYDVYAHTVAPGDVIDVSVTATAVTPALLLQRSTKPAELVWFEGASGAGRLATSRVADTAETWYFAVTARDENATGGYEIRIVKNGNDIVPTALVEYGFTYDKAGNLVSTTENQAAVADMYGFGPATSGLGVRTSHTPDALNRVTRYEQGVPGAATTKRADYAYRPDGSVGTVTRFAGAGTNPVATSTATYDGLGRLTGITHAPAASASIAYGFAYDAASRMTAMTTPEGTSTFALDATDQLVSASLTGEAYAYDYTGNRTSGGAQTGTGNRLLFDGTYRYAYDAEGNRTAKFLDNDGNAALSAGDTDVTVYGWDQRNRLVAVSHVNAWTSTQAAGLAAFNATGTGLPGSDLELQYTYDYADRRIRRSIDADGTAGAGQESVSFAAYAGDIRAIEVSRPNDKLVIDPATGKVFGFLGQVVQRNFYGNGVDEILAVDRIAWSSSTPTTSTFWTLSDHQDSVRDIVSGTGATLGQVVEHRQFDSFGKVVRRTTGPQSTAPATAGVGVEFGYAGRPLEDRTGLSDNRARWYEPSTGRFINEDPSGFRGGDANLFRYVGNDPLDQVDPSGLAAKWAQQSGKAPVPAAAFAGLAQPYAMTTSAVGSSYGTPSVATQTISLAAPSTAKATPVAPKPFASLATTVSDSRGTVYTPVAVASAPRSTESSRWSLLDRVTKQAADAAYDVKDGGLLSQFVKNYDPTGRTGKFGKAGFSATLSRASDYDPAGSPNMYILALPGTRGLWDWWANAWQFLGYETSQYRQGIDLAGAVKRNLPEGASLITTGHSKGAGQAIAIAYAVGIDAIVHNPASVSPLHLEGTPGEIRTHITLGDPLSVLRTLNNISGQDQPMAPGNRIVPGQIFVHLPRSLWTHGTDSLPR